MELPIQVTFHGMDASPALDTAIREKAGKLDRFHPHVMSCRAVVEETGLHKTHGRMFAVRLDIKVKGAEIAITREHDEDPFVAVRDAFDVAKRQLEERSRRLRAEAKGGRE